jgi:hypothetical protein
MTAVAAWHVVSDAAGTQDGDACSIPGVNLCFVFGARSVGQHKACLLGAAAAAGCGHTS